MSTQQNEEFKCAMSNAEDACYDIRKQMDRVGFALSNENPFKVMSELAEINKLVHDAMQHALHAQQIKIEEQKTEMQRFG